MIKILFLIPDLSGGGAERVLCNLVNHMDQSKFEITVQTVNEYDPKKYLAEGIRYKAINRCKTRIGKSLMNYWYRFCTEYKLTYPLYIKDDYDIEVAYLECGATKVLAASTNKKAKKVAWVHCDAKKKGLTAEKTGRYYSKYDKVVCVSQEARKSFDEMLSDYADSTVLYNVIDEAEIFRKIQETNSLNWNKEVFHLLTVGRLSYEKGCDRLVEVCRRLKEEGYLFQLHFLGDGPDKKKLQKEFDAKGLSHNVVFEGFSSNPYLYMNQADLIVIPSRTEALSTVAVEALILGKAVVTTPCSGMRELFGESEFGVVTEHSVESLYCNVKRMMDSEELRHRYSRLAEQRGLRFKSEATVKQTEQFFIDLLR